MFRVDKYLDLDQTEFSTIFKNVNNVWEVLLDIDTFIQKQRAWLIDNGYCEESKDVFIAEDAVISQSAHIEGPAIIGKNTHVRHGAFIRGKVVIGNNCVIGNSCEIKNSFIFNNVQIPHFNYVGDSIMGYKSHIGAGVILSNVKSIPGNVSVKGSDYSIDTGLRKFSAVIGDFVEVGCNSVLNPGTIIGRHSVVYPLTNVRGVIEDHSILKNDGSVVKKREEV